MPPIDATTATGEVGTQPPFLDPPSVESLARAIADRKPPIVNRSHDLPTANSATGTLHHWLLLFGSAAVIAVAGILEVRDREGVGVAGMDRPLPGICTFRRLTGQPCPGCGLTRCFVSIAHGDVVAAVTFNAAGLLIFGVVAAQIPYRAVQLWRIRRGRRELQMTRLASWLLCGTVALMLIQWALRLWGGVS